MADVERIRALSKCTSIDRCIAIETNLRSSATSEALGKLLELVDQFVQSTEHIRLQLLCQVCSTWLGRSHKPGRGASAGAVKGSSSYFSAPSYCMCLSCHDAPLMCHWCFAETHALDEQPLRLPIDRGLLLGDVWAGSPSPAQVTEIANTFFLEALSAPALVLEGDVKGSENTSAAGSESSPQVSTTWRTVLLDSEARENLNKPHVLLEMVTLDRAVVDVIRTTWLGILHEKELEQEDAASVAALGLLPEAWSHKQAGYDHPVKCELTGGIRRVRLQLELSAVIWLEHREREQLQVFQHGRFEVFQQELLCGEEDTDRASALESWHRGWESIVLAARRTVAATRNRCLLQEMVRQALTRACSAVFIEIHAANVVRAFAEDYHTPLQSHFQQVVKPAADDYKGEPGSVAYVTYIEGIARRDITARWLGAARDGYDQLLREIDTCAKLDASSAMLLDHAEFGSVYYRMYFSSFVLIVGSKFLDRQHVNYVKAKQRSETLMFQCLYNVDRVREVLAERRERIEIRYLEKSCRCFAAEHAARIILQVDCWQSLANDLGTQQRMNRLVLERLFVSERREMLNAFWASTRFDGYSIFQQMTREVSPKYAAVFHGLEHTMRDWLMKFLGERYGLHFVDCYVWSPGSERLLSLFWNFPPPSTWSTGTELMYAGSAGGVHLVIPATPAGHEGPRRGGGAGGALDVPNLHLTHQGSIVRSLKSQKQEQKGALTPSSSSSRLKGENKPAPSPAPTPWSTPRRATFSSAMASSRWDPAPSFLSLINSANRVPARSSKGFMTALTLMESMVVWSNGCAAGHATIRHLPWRNDFQNRWESYEELLLSSSEADWDALLYENEMSHFARFEMFQSQHNIVRLKAATPSFKHAAKAAHHQRGADADAQSSSTGPTPRHGDDVASSSGGRVPSSSSREYGLGEKGKSPRRRRDVTDHLDSPNEIHRRPLGILSPRDRSGAVAQQSFATLRKQLLSDTERSFGRHFLFGPNIHPFEQGPERQPKSTYEARHEELKRRAHERWEMQDQANTKSSKGKPPAGPGEQDQSRQKLGRPASASLMRKDTASSPLSLSATITGTSPDMSISRVESEDMPPTNGSRSTLSRFASGKRSMRHRSEDKDQLLRVPGATAARRLTVEVNKLDCFQVDFTSSGQ